MKHVVLTLLAAAVFAVPAARAADRKPNVILIVADDLGYADLGCHGGKEIPTPNIDSLAKNGVRCTNGYVSCPVCSPTRAGLVTGRYQQRFGHEFNPGPPATASKEFGLPLTEVTLANRLKGAGYATVMVGKWHLGYEPKFHPMKRGFDEFFGFPGGAHHYLNAKAAPDNPILRGTEAVDEKEYLTDAFTREAVAAIDKHHKHPFFLYLTYNAVHAPMQATKKYLDRFEKIADEKRRTYAAMLSAMDDGVGAVLDKVRQTGVEDNTLIFFVSDNGGPPPANASRNDPLRERKGTTYEGGVRVPFLVQWKGKLPAGKTYDHPVIALDIHPTAAAAAGAKLAADAKLDGVDLLPYLTGSNEKRPHETLYWRFGERTAVRHGNWKLVKNGLGEAQLFDLVNDIGEKKDLASEKPEKAKELAALYAKWNSELAKPLWGQPRR